MAVTVEHEKRRAEILEKALDLFASEGYQDVTFQKIADRCNITRTTLYIYFKNKREIFKWSIKQCTSSIEERLLTLVNNQNQSAPDCLEKMLCIIFDECEKNKQLFKVLLVYFMELQKKPVDPSRMIERRIIRVQHLFSTVIIRGQKNGELRKVSVKEVNKLLYMCIENAAFRLAVLGKQDLKESRELVPFVIQGIKA